MNTTTQSNRRFSGNNGEFKQYLSFDKKFGYLHEVREVPNSKPKVYAARISVPLGQGQNTQYLTFELYIKSAEALILFFEHSDAINHDETKVTIRFSCNNVFPRAYVAKNGQHEGEIISYLAGNLSFIHTMKIDGEVVHGNQYAEPTDNTSHENAQKSGSKPEAAVRNHGQSAESTSAVDDNALNAANSDPSSGESSADQESAMPTTEGTKDSSKTASSTPSHRKTTAKTGNAKKSA